MQVWVWSRSYHTCTCLAVYQDFFLDFREKRPSLGLGPCEVGLVHIATGRHRLNIVRTARRRMASLRLPSYTSLSAVEVYKAQLKSYLEEGGYWRCVTEDATVTASELEEEAAQETPKDSASISSSANALEMNVEQRPEAHASENVSSNDAGQKVEQVPTIIDEHGFRASPGAWDWVLGNSASNIEAQRTHMSGITRYVSEGGWAIPLHYVWETKPPTPPTNFFQAPKTTVPYDVPMQLLNTALENLVAFKESLTRLELGSENNTPQDQSPTEEEDFRQTEEEMICPEMRNRDYDPPFQRSGRYYF